MFLWIFLDRKLTSRKLKVQEKLEAQVNRLVVTKDQRLEEECLKPQYQSPCKPGQVRQRGQLVTDDSQPHVGMAGTVYSWLLHICWKFVLDTLHTNRCANFTEFTTLIYLIKIQYRICACSGVCFCIFNDVAIYKCLDLLTYLFIDLDMPQRSLNTALFTGEAKSKCGSTGGYR